jgi:PhnB protein
MKAINYLQFLGNASEAISYYEKILPNAKVKKATFGMMGENQNLPLSIEEKNMIMEAKIEFLDNTLMLSDVPPFMTEAIGSIVNGNNIIISLIDGEEKMNQDIFNGLAKEGTIIMPLSNVPWSENFGIVIDKFDITWKFNSSATSFLEQFQ